MQASKRGQTGKVRELLSRGADVHAHDEAALRWAIVEGHIETAKVLKVAAEKGVRLSDDNEIVFVSCTTFIWSQLFTVAVRPRRPTETPGEGTAGKGSLGRIIGPSKSVMASSAPDSHCRQKLQLKRLAVPAVGY